MISPAGPDDGTSAHDPTIGLARLDNAGSEA